MLKSLPSDLCLMLILATQSLYASVSIAENIKLDSVGARKQPCLMPLETGKDFIVFHIIIIITSDTDKSIL